MTKLLATGTNGTILEAERVDFTQSIPSLAKNI